MSQHPQLGSVRRLIDDLSGLRNAALANDEPDLAELMGEALAALVFLRHYLERRQP